MDMSTEIERAVLEMKRTAHNIESLRHQLDFFNGEIAYITAQRIEGFGAKIVKDRNCGKVTREGLRAGRKKYDMDGLSKMREGFEGNAAFTILQIAEAEVERATAADEMRRVCVYD